MKSTFGKIEQSFFKKFIESKCGKERDEVVTKPKFGVDVSVINISNNQAIALASDPLSLIMQLGLEKSAWLSVHLTANDIATTGFPPLYAQFVLNLPPFISQKDFEIYWNYIHQFCFDINLTITGGHTGFVEGQNSTIIGGATFLTIAPQNQLLTSDSSKEGDSILITKSCAIASSAILSLSFPETVKNKAGIENYQKACESFYDISVLQDALKAVGGGNKKYITAMHDVTEGGVLGAIYELATASGNGALIYDDKIPINDTQAAVCKVFSLNPRYSMGVGSMIITCKKEGVEKIINELQKFDILCTEIGSITNKKNGIKLRKGNKETDIIYQGKDPYWEAFYQAIKSKWK